MLHKILYFLFGYLFLFIISNSVFASSFYDFSSPELNEWQFVHVMGQSENSWYVADGWLKGEIGYNSSSHLLLKNNIGTDDYTVEIDAINLSGVDQSIMFRVSDDKSSYYLADFRYNDPEWVQDNNNFRLWVHRDNNYYLLDQKTPFELGNVVSLSQGVKHTIKIQCQGQSIKVYFDSVLVFDHTSSQDEYSWTGSGFGFRNWGGSYYSTTVKNLFDNVNINFEGHEEEVDKVVILPGLGASWNSQAIVYNEEVGVDSWQMTPFVKVYDGLVAELEAKGLVEGEDFWVWNYDWRRPVVEIVENFDNFLDSKIEEGEKVSLIGHSLGGLVARLWAADNSQDERLEKVISLGSPHMGSVAAYEAWSGAKVSDKFDIRSIALNVLLQIQKQNRQTKVETIRDYAPVLKDLMPVFDFTVLGRNSIGWQDLESKNDYLFGENEKLSSLEDILTPIAAIGEETKNTIYLKRRSVFDRVLGQWPDGVPVRYDFADGDATVLKTSAWPEGFEAVEVVADHSGVVNKSVAKVLAILGLGETETMLEEYDDLTDNLVIFVGSPVKVEIDCQENNYQTDNVGFVVLPDEENGNCQLKIVPIGSGGKYHLVIGRTDTDNWMYFEGEVLAGDEQVIEVDAKEGVLAENEMTKDYLYGLIAGDLTAFEDRDDAEDEVEDRDSEKLLKEIMKLREEEEETIVTDRILENLKTILKMDNKKAGRMKAYLSYKKAGKERLKSMKNRHPDVFEAINFDLAEKYYERCKQAYGQKKYGATAALGQIAEDLYELAD